MDSGKVVHTSLVSAESAGTSGRRDIEHRKKLVQAELRKLRDITKDSIPDDKRKVVMPLLANLAFLKVKLDESRADLLGEKIYTEYDNGGGQTGIREHPGFSAYNKLLTTYARAIKQLADMMPSGSAAADQLIDYLNETRFG